MGFYPAPESRRIVVDFDDGTQRFLDIGGKVEVGSGWFATVNYYVRVSDLDDLTFVREQTLRRVLPGDGCSTVAGSKKVGRRDVREDAPFSQAL